MKKLFVIMTLVLFTGCAGHIQGLLDSSNLTNVEYQARRQALKSLRHTLSRSTTLKRKCRIKADMAMPKVLYYNTHEAVAVACRTRVDPVLQLSSQTPGGCYIDEVPVIIINTARRQRDYLNSIYKKLVHEYSHHYYKYGGLSDFCKSEVFAQWNTHKAINSLILFTPGL